MTNLTFSQDIALSLYNSAESHPIDLDEAWQWLGYNQKSECLSKLKSNFEEGGDFSAKSLKSPTGGRPRACVMITVDCFKSMGMMTGTSQGKVIRKYFLECEKIAKARPALPQTYAEALRSLADTVEQKQVLLEANQALRIEVQVLEPKAERYDLVLAMDGWMTGEEVVKQLAIPKFSVRKLYDILRTEKVLFRRADGINCPYADWVNGGFAKLRDGKCFDGRMRFSPSLSWKGLDYILDLLRKHQIISKDKQYQFNFDSRAIAPMKLG